jgi:integrase
MFKALSKEVFLMPETKENEAGLQEKGNTSHAILLSEFEAKQRGEELQVKRKKPQRANERADFALKHEDCLRIINAAQGPRDRTIIGLLYFALLRRDEVRSLGIENVNFPNHRLDLTRTKGGKPRSVPIVEDSVLLGLQDIIGKRTKGWVFVSKSKDGRFSNKAINDIVAKTAARAGVSNPAPGMKNVNPHIFRHSRARFLRRQSPPMAIECLQRIMGHSTIKTTLDIYGRPDLAFMEEELRRCSTTSKQ